MHEKAEFSERKIQDALEEVEMKALKSLAGYKFQMFGYWASIWVHLNRLFPRSGERRPNPFRHLVKVAKSPDWTHKINET